MKRLLLLLALTCALLPLAPGQAQAKPQLVSIWLQGHGVVANGQGNYFSGENGPYVGFGGQLGARLLFFEAFLDLNVFDSGRDAGEAHPTLFHHLGGGLYVPIKLTPVLRGFARANVSYVARAPYPDRGSNSGALFRAGGGLEVLPAKFFAIGAGVYGGYHMFGSRALGHNGSNLMAQLYGRFELGF